MGVNPRSESRTTALRLQVAARDGYLCYRCRQAGKPLDQCRINPALRYPHRYSVTLEHVLPPGVTLEQWTQAGHDPYDPAICTVSHRTCNSSAGTTMRNLLRKTTRRTTRLNTSRAW